MNMQRARVAYEYALREAVRDGRSMSWVAGIPALWGAHDAVVVVRLWGEATDCRYVP